MTARGRRRAFALLVAACGLGAGAAVALGPERAGPSAAGLAMARTALTERSAIVFQRAGGAVAVAARADGTPAATRLRCDRVYFAAGRGLCLARTGGFAAGYRAEVFDSAFQVRHALALAGIPSRARVSPDGRLGAVTMFVTGHSYEAAGTFSTQTTLISLADGRPIAELEDFRVMHGEREVTAVDQNFWGVTFARDGNRFYATLATGGRTYLIVGSVRERSARIIHRNVECPSLSPDETRIAFKKRTPSSERPWRLTVLDLRTLRETPLGELRSVDDQAEWRDDGHVLYGLAGAIYEVSADGRGTPRRILDQASSPAAQRVSSVPRPPFLR